MTGIILFNRYYEVFVQPAERAYIDMVCDCIRFWSKAIA